MTAPDIQIVEGLIVQPGDTLVVRVDPERMVDQAELLAFKRDLEAALPAKVDVVMVNADQLALVLAPEVPDGNGH